jgi:DNA invertase Pin-like site-specific DNA recombinase
LPELEERAMVISDNSPLAYSYIRFSSRQQAKGDSLRRQTEAAAAWCGRHGAKLDTSTTFHDLGKSAFLGDHRKNADRFALAAFLKLVEREKIPRGSYLIIESLDRLTREHVRAGLMLLLGLIEAGIRIVQLSPSELVYDEDSDEMSLMLAIVELSRGHRESKRKSDLIAPVWRRRKDSAREGGIVTRRLPAWVQVKDGKLALIPERAEAVRTVFRLAAAGYGIRRIIAKLTADGVPPMGPAGVWSRASVGKILLNRHAVGDYQPRKGRDRVPDGDPVPNYYPAVVTEAEFYAARSAMADRRGRPGRVGSRRMNLFAGLLRDARDGGTYQLTTKYRNGRVEPYGALVNDAALAGRATAHSIPYDVFESAVLSLLAEIDPAEIVGDRRTTGRVAALAGQLAEAEGKIAALEAELLQGDVPAIARVLRGLEATRRDLAARLAEAKAEAAHPLAESWGEARSLAEALDSAPDPEDARTRLRMLLRRLVSEGWLLVVRRGLVQLAALQLYFSGDGKRDFLIYHRRAFHAGCGRREAEWRARSFAEGELVPGGLDLRKPSHVKRLERVLLTLDLSSLAP